jgi:hypothetical protein
VNESTFNGIKTDRNIFKFFYPIELKQHIFIEGEKLNLEPE